MTTLSSTKVVGPLEDLTFKIIGAAMAVHNELGPGFKESAYHRALSLQLAKAGLGFHEEEPLTIDVDGSRVGLLYLDHIVEGSVIVEEKSFSHMLTNEEIAQAITYLAATGLQVALLINFGRRKLEYRRIFPPKNVNAWSQRVIRYLWRPPAGY